MLLDQSSVFVDLQLCKTDHFSIKPLDELSITACFLHDCTILCSNLVKHPFLQPWSSFVCSFQAAAVSIRPVIDIASVELLEFYQKRGVFPQTQTDILAAWDQKVNCSLLCQVVSAAESSDPWNESSCRHPDEWKDADSLSSYGFSWFSCASTQKPCSCFADLCVCVNKVNIHIPLFNFFFNPVSSIQSSFTMPRWTTVDNWNWLPRKVCDYKHLLLCSY